MAESDARSDAWEKTAEAADNAWNAYKAASEANRDAWDAYKAASEANDNAWDAYQVALKAAEEAWATYRHTGKVTDEISRGRLMNLLRRHLKKKASFADLRQSVDPCPNCGGKQYETESYLNACSVAACRLNGPVTYHLGCGSQWRDSCADCGALLYDSAQDEIDSAEWEEECYICQQCEADGVQPGHFACGTIFYIPRRGERI